MPMWSGDPKKRALLDSLLSPEWNEQRLRKRLADNVLPSSMELGRLPSPRELAAILGVDVSYIDVVLPELEYLSSDKTSNPWIGYSDDPDPAILAVLEHTQSCALERAMLVQQDQIARTDNDLHTLARAALPPVHAHFYSQTLQDVLQASNFSGEQFDDERRHLVTTLIDSIWRARLDLPESPRPESSALRAAATAALTATSLVGTVATVVTTNPSFGLILAILTFIILVALSAASWTYLAHHRRPRKRKSAR